MPNTPPHSISHTEVHKFGGTSVSEKAGLDRVSAIIAQQAHQKRIVVVASAMSGITDAIVAAANAAQKGDGPQAIKWVQQIRERHVGVDHNVDAQIERICSELEELLCAAARLHEISPRVRDRVLSCGEKLSVTLLAQSICSLGSNATPVFADEFLETDGNHGCANPLQVVADRTTRAKLNPLLDAGVIPVVTGFCGIGPDGSTTTLGRGGSDYTATLIAAALGANEVTIWTDIDGVYSANPNMVPQAQVVKHLNYREAAELSYYGAKVLHQRTMIPVMQQRIPVRIRDTFHPEQAGTVVDDRFTPGSHPVKAISAIPNQALVSIEGKGMAGVPGIAARVFRSLAARDISVTMISQSSSESSITLAVPSPFAQDAEAALKKEFRSDIGHGDIEEVLVKQDISLVAAVGLGMAHTPGIAERVFGALGRAGINILAIAQGSSELNVSLAVSDADLTQSLLALHEEFGLHRVDTGDDNPNRMDLMLLGCGQIGRALMALVETRQEHIYERFGLNLRIVAVGDRSGFLFVPSGIANTTLKDLAAHKQAGHTIASFENGTSAPSPTAMVESALHYRLVRPVLVDVSDADNAADAMMAALERGADVVTANKKPLAGPLETAEALEDTRKRTHRIVRGEATVGAGLPVLDTLEMLQATGDRLNSAEGCLSGTLGFLMSRIEEGQRFSEAVRQAMELGYTEPDPVVDLSGMDVARKAIILARASDLGDTTATVTPTSLVDIGLMGASKETLFAALEKQDDELAARVAQARQDGKVLRYVARVSDDAICVGIEAVPMDSPIGQLKGSDNIIVFRSERYHDRPLVITGPGAGIDVTAMGVLADVLRIAAERRTA